MVRIEKFETLTPVQREDAARLLRDVFDHQPAGWHTMEEAREEVESFFTDPDRRAWACLEGDRPIGWIGRIETYNGHVWELHPILVDPDFQRRGLGTLLIDTLEAAARAAGVSTIQLGTDDENDGTNIFGVDLYPDIWRRIRDIAPTNGHALSFYQRKGYAVYGILPDANGLGRHDILMAKRIR